MNLRTAFAVAALSSTWLIAPLAVAEGLTNVGKPYESTHVLPGERMLAGSQRGVPLFVDGVVDTMNVPVTIAQQVTDETRKYGPLGVISGAIRGGLKAGFLAGRALSRGAMGTLDVMSTPMGRID